MIHVTNTLSFSLLPPINALHIFMPRYIIQDHFPMIPFFHVWDQIQFSVPSVKPGGSCFGVGFPEL